MTLSKAKRPIQPKATDLVRHPLTLQEIFVVSAWRVFDFTSFLVAFVRDQIYQLNQRLNQKAPPDLLGPKHDPEAVWGLCQWVIALAWVFSVSIFFRQLLGR